MHRRLFLRNLACLAGGVLINPASGLAAIQDTYLSRPRELWLKRKQTGEQDKVLYWDKGQYLIDGMTRLCILTRDIESNQAVQMSPLLFDLVFASQELAVSHGMQRWFTVTSGYRAIRTNSRTEGAAHLSRHQYGDAVDGFRENVGMTDNARLFWALQGGGVGLYNGHVHADVYKRRFWRKGV